MGVQNYGVPSKKLVTNACKNVLDHKEWLVSRSHLVIERSIKCLILSSRAFFFFTIFGLFFVRRIRPRFKTDLSGDLLLGYIVLLGGASGFSLDFTAQPQSRARAWLRPGARRPNKHGLTCLQAGQQEQSVRKPRRPRQGASGRSRPTAAACSFWFALS